MSLRGTRLGIHLALTLMAWAALSQRTVRADDWLAALPACSFGQTASVPRYELLYPRAGLPALVEAGETLVTRVRLPAPLTPPPGIQQPRALVGWRAELSGHAWPVSPTDMIPQRQALDVVNVRPDSAASLIYRAAVPIPAWVAPGSYDFALWAPGGSAIARGALRVLAPGHAPRLAWIDAAAPPPSMAVAGLPIDAWVCAASSTRTCMSDAAGGGATTGMHDGAGLVAAPILNVGGLVAALRVGRGLWTLGSCEAGGLGLADETRSVLARERRVPFVPAAPSLTPTQFQAFGESARAWPAPDALALERGGEQLHVRVARDFPCAVELALLLPLAARPLQLRAGAFELYPAGEIVGAALPALVAILNLPAGGSATVERGTGTRAVLPAELRAAPEIANSDAPVRFRVAATAAKVRVAWRLDPLRTAFGPSSIETSFRPLGDHRVTAFVLAEDGRSARLEAHVRVRTARASGCGLGSARVSAARPTLGSAGLFWLALVCVRRRTAKKAPARLEPE